jgi:transposase-like protein
MPEQTKSIDLPALIRRFSDETACRELLEELRWPDGPQCPRCEHVGATRVKGRETLDCNACHYQFSVRVGTVLQDSKLPLWTWFLGTYMMVEARKGVSSNQLKRMLGVSYKTAWYLSHRIRAAMTLANPEPLSGVVEVDETWVGGRRRGVGKGNWRQDKTIVIGALERGGDIRLKVERSNDRRTLHGFVKSVVGDDASAIHTDEWFAYRGIGDENTRHESVNHRDEEWVRGEVHTQGIESAWSLLKRSIVGSYHQLSAKHLPAYLDEMSFRFNNRNNPFLFRDTLRVLMSSDNLEYKDLTA